MSLLRFFRVDLAVTVAALVVAYFYGGWSATLLTLILIAVEVVFSFDNAAVNSKYVGLLNRRWQTVFLTVGILIAVFGMRLVFPLLIVSISAGVGPVEAVQLALERGDPSIPGTYGYVLHAAHPTIAAFGGTFLFMLFCDFLFDTEREETWMTLIERPLIKAGRLSSISVLATLAALLLATQLADPEHRQAVLLSGVVGAITYLAVSGVATVMQDRQATKDESLARVGGAGLFGAAALSVFLFLEVLDASFSFDGVIGAFAITPDPLIIALGLGVGALYVRSMTVYLVRRGTLAQYPYLEHGAHWAIGALAVLLLLTLRWEIPDIAIGLVGITFIAASFLSSVRANKRAEADSAPDPEALDDTACLADAAVTDPA